MEFACENCRNRYMISDDKVGAKGVKVRCRKCGHVTRVQRPAPAAGEMDETQVMSTVPGPESPVGPEPVDGAAEASASEPEEAVSKDELAANASASGSSDSGAEGAPGSSEPVAASAPQALPGPPVSDPAPSSSGADPNLFAGAEDEIGAMFDSVLGGAEPPRGGNGAPQEDFEQTRVVDANAMQKLAEATADSPSQKAPSDEQGPPVEHEWFAAIDDQQKGPFTFEALKELWDKGEIGPDSLCWRAGFADWIPLSEVSELTSRFAPAPKKPVISTTAVASANAEMDEAPERGKGSPGGWQPSAASALASLVQDEITALKRPATPAATPSIAAHGGALDLPEDPLGDAATVPRGAPLAASLLAEAGLPQSQGPAGSGLGTLSRGMPLSAEAPVGTLSHGVPLASPGLGTLSHGMPLDGNAQLPNGHTGTSGQALRAPPPYAYSAPAHGRVGGSRNLMYGLIIGGAVVIIALIGTVAYLAGRTENGPAPVAARTPAPVAPAPVQQRPAPTPVKPAPSAPTQPPVTAAAQPGTKTQAPTAASPKSPSSAPLVAALSPAPHPETPAEAPAKTPDETSTRHHRTHRHHHRLPSRPHPAQVAVRPPHHASGGGGGDDFDAIFGGGGGDSGGHGGGHHSTNAAVYVPPAPGDEQLPSRLPQSEILQVVVSHKSDLLDCVSGQRKRKPGTKGKLIMGWTILASGRTSRIAAETASLRSSYLAHCMSGLIRHWRFPRHKGSGQHVNFPFTF